MTKPSERARHTAEGIYHLREQKIPKGPVLGALEEEAISWIAGRIQSALDAERDELRDEAVVCVVHRLRSERDRLRKTQLTAEEAVCLLYHWIGDVVGVEYVPHTDEWEDILEAKLREIAGEEK